MFLFFTLVIVSLFRSADFVTIRIGVAADENVMNNNVGWSVCGGAIGMAMDRLTAQGLLNNITLEFYIRYTECSASTTVGVGVEFFQTLNVDVVIGPPCPRANYMMGYMASFYKTLMIGYGFFIDSQFSSISKFPWLFTTVSNSLSLGYSALSVLEHFKWNQVAILYTVDPVNYCQTITSDLENALNDVNSYQVRINYKQVINSADVNWPDTLREIKRVARIIMFCMDSSTDKRTFMIQAKAAGMDTDEYQFILVDMRSFGFGQRADGQKTTLSNGLSPFWEDVTGNNADGKDDVAKGMASRIMVIDQGNDVQDQAYAEQFKRDVVKRILLPPTSCDTQACLNAASQNAPMGVFARHLYDSMYMYVLSLNKLLKSGGNFSDPNQVTNGIIGTFQGLSGEVNINANITRDPEFIIYTLDKNYNQASVMQVSCKMGMGYSVNTTVLMTSDNDIWPNHNGVRPLAVPVCNFSGLDCPPTFLQKYLIYVIVGAVIVSVTVIASIIITCYVISVHRAEKRRQMEEWQIPRARLTEPLKRNKKGSTASRPSLQSTPSSRTTDTSDTQKTNMGEYRIFMLNRDSVMTLNFDSKTLDEKELLHFAQLRKIEHDNVNKFIGMSIDGADFISVWKLCARGSIERLIEAGDLQLDPVFISCIIRDIASGLQYIHSSSLGFHGSLHSGCCMVNDGWQVKISCHGMGMLKREEGEYRKLWLAPEHLRKDSAGTKEGDVYSFAIICSEVITRKSVWDLKNRREKLEEILFLIKSGKDDNMRPALHTGELDIGSTLLHLVRDCWNERPEKRPTADIIVQLLAGILTKKTNLFDHVFNMMEEYTTTLELEVEERTKELSTEKKKADILLSKMLPKQVAERLKLGQTVEPEGFDNVTVFFSDVVKFTQLSQKCSPFQIVTLLNDLYSGLDSIIEDFDAYKVESIGDGYLCVSGLPLRNGFQHIRQIVDMSLAFMNYVKAFRIGHLPRERVELRIGINSGPCVAGVVGLSMPRYCLFGDTVNTASRMESNGKASYIHASLAAVDLLRKHYPNDYELASRGDVIIKGKGVMETFWILGQAGEVHHHIDEEKPAVPEHRGVKQNSEESTEPMYSEFVKQINNQKE